MKRWIGVLIGAAIVLFVAIYLASPLFAITALQSAARAGDQDRLSLLVDFPSVRDNLKSSVSAYVLKSMRDDPQMADNPFAGLGALVAPAIVDRVIDTYVTPDGLSAMIKSGKAPKLDAGVSAGPQSSMDTPPPLQVSFGYIDLDHFRARLTRSDSLGVELSLVLERRGLFSWKLIRIDLPIGEVTSAPSVTPAVAPAADSATAVSAGPEVSDDAPKPPPDALSELSSSDEPLFGQHQVPVFRGPMVPPDFEGRDHGARLFRTMIVDSVHEGPTYAGSLAVALFGCGTDCAMGFVTDLRTGQVFDLPAQGESHPDLSLQYVRDSTLIRANWNSVGTDAASPCIYEDFEWTGTGFSSLGRRTDNHPCPR